MTSPTSNKLVERVEILEQQTSDSKAEVHDLYQDVSYLYQYIEDLNREMESLKNENKLLARTIAALTHLPEEVEKISKLSERLLEILDETSGHDVHSDSDQKNINPHMYT